MSDNKDIVLPYGVVMESVVAQAIASTDSSLVVIPNQPIIRCGNIVAYEPKES